MQALAYLPFRILCDKGNKLIRMCNNIFFSEVRQYIQLPDQLKPEDAFELDRLFRASIR